MTDVETTFRSELERMLVVDATPDWEAVLVTAGVGRGSGQRRQRLVVAAAALLAAAAVSLVTPLGGAIARTLDEFSTWLTGNPGAPVSEEEQRAFEEENERSWLGFPVGTELRRLVTRRVGDSTVELFGLRSETRLCLRLTVSGADTKRATECAPLDELHRDAGAVRVLIADEHVGRGDKVVWYGLDRVPSAKLLVTAGIAADGVDAVALRDDGGRHEVPVESNAFLYVAEEPEVGQRVREVWARTHDRLVQVPFAPVPFGFGSSGAAAPAVPPPAPAVEREVRSGTIGWLEAREERGEPLESLPERVRRNILRHLEDGTIVFGRVVTPDPDRPLRFWVSLNSHRPGGDAAGLCTFSLGSRGGGGGCAPYPRVFEGFAGEPVAIGMSAGGAGAFVTATGYASDDVARLEAVLADGQKVHVPLQDNFLAVDLPRAALPAIVVAYDSDDRVISVSRPLTDFFLGFGGGRAAPAPGKAELVWRATGPGESYFELSVGPSDQGGECQYLKHFIDERHTGLSQECAGARWEGPPVQVQAPARPPIWLSGRVRDDVKSVRIRFADGGSVQLEPRRGYVLYAMPRHRMTEARAAIAAEGLDAGGRVIGRTTFP